MSLCGWVPKPAPEAKAAIQKSFGGGQGYFWCHEVFNFKTMEPLALEAYREKAKGLEKACIDGAIARAEEAVADWGAGAGAKRGAGPPEGAGLDWTAGLRDDSGKRPNFGGGGGAAQGGTSGAALNGEPADSSAGTRFPLLRLSGFRTGTFVHPPGFPPRGAALSQRFPTR